MPRIIQAVSLALTILGWIAYPVATIWLLILGQWWVLLVVVGTIVVAPFLLMAGMVPGAFLAAIAAKRAAGRKPLAMGAAFFGLAYVAALITVWCMLAFELLIQRAPPGGTWPMMLLVYAVGTGPWRFLARKELAEGRRGETVQTFFLQLAMAIVLLGHVTFTPPVEWLWWTFGAVMLLEVIAYPFVVASGPDPEPTPAVATTPS